MYNIPLFPCPMDFARKLEDKNSYLWLLTTLPTRFR